MLIALDIGNVCMKLNVLESNQALGFDSSDLPREFIDLSNDYELGKIQTPDFLNRLARLSNLQEFDAMQAWMIKIGETIPGMNEAIRDFAAQGVEFVFLSDTNDLHMTKIRRTLPFINFVKGEILSQRIGFSKPNPEIFAAFESEYGIPDLYFDDLEKNISGAIKRNWNAIQFIDAKQFRKCVELYTAERQ